MPMTIAERRDAYAAEYLRRWSNCKIDPERVSEAKGVARTMLKNRARYEGISRRVNGVPWWWIGISHNRESGMDFTKHLHEGSPLTGKTRDVPKGRPKVAPANGTSYTFEESAIDALTMPGKNYDKIGHWDVVEVFLRFEQYNGFGYRGKGIPSPYLWAATNQSDERGKYVRDGVFDRTAHDSQLGCAAIMLALEELGVALFPDEIAPPVNDDKPGEQNPKLQVPNLPPQPDFTDKETVMRVQERLKTLGYGVGGIDGKKGKLTDGAILSFRQENGLDLGTDIDQSLLVALMTAKPRDFSEREAMTPTQVRQIVPEAHASFLSKIWAGTAGVGSALMAAITGVAGNISSAKGYIDPVKDMASDVPGWVWFMVVGAIAFAIWKVSSSGEQKAIEAFQSGERR